MATFRYENCHKRALAGGKNYNGMCRKTVDFRMKNIFDLKK